MADFPPYTARYKGVRGKLKLIGLAAKDAVVPKSMRGLGTGEYGRGEGEQARTRRDAIDRAVDGNDELRDRDAVRR